LKVKSTEFADGIEYRVIRMGAKMITNVMVLILNKIVTVIRKNWK
jgi:hypothetical protein